MLSLIGGAVDARGAQQGDRERLRRRPPVSGAAVTGNCGDGVRDFGTTDATGYLEVRVPHVTCDFTAANASATGQGRRGQRRQGRSRSRPPPAAPAAPCRRRWR